MNKFFFSQRTIFIFLGLLFLFTRLYNLTLLPIFTDESIYLYWAKIIGTTHAHWFISLTDGKPPLFIWILTFFVKVFPVSLYLLAGRLVSVFAGGIAIIGIYKLSLLLFESKRAGFFTVFLYIIFPFALFYDRIALYDSFLSAMLVWSVYFAIKTSKTLKIKDAFLWGLFLGFSLLTKPPAIIFLFLTPVCFLLQFSLKKIQMYWKKIVVSFVIALGVAEVIQAIENLSLNNQVIMERSQKFQLPVNEFISAPFVLIGSNIQQMLNWVVSFYTLPLFLLGCIALVVLLIKDFKKGLILLILWIIPILIFATGGKILFPRYILFTSPYFIIALGYIGMLLSSRIQKFFLIAMGVIFIFFSLRFDFYLLTNPVLAPLPPIEREQYITSKYSGYGLKEIFAFIDTELDRGPQITLLTEGKFGLFPYAFSLYYWNENRLNIIPTWIPENLEYDLYELKRSARVYIVFSNQEKLPDKFPLRLIMKTEKPSGFHKILLSEVKDKE